MTPKPAFNLGQRVYQRINPGTPGMVVGIVLRPGHLSYLVIWSDEECERPHFEMELTEDKEYVLDK